MDEVAASSEEQTSSMDVASSLVVTNPSPEVEATNQNLPSRVTKPLQSGRPSGGKRLPGNMIPRRLPVVPPQIQMAQEIITKLGDYSSMDDVNSLPANIESAAAVFISVGDLKTFSDEIASIFLKCFTQLSVQIPILASLLALIHAAEADFVGLVVEKVQARLLVALRENEIPTSKLLLRALACLVSCGCLDARSLEGLLSPLVDVVASIVADEVTEEQEVAAYLLSSTLIWTLEALNKNVETAQLVERSLSVLQKLLEVRKSPFGVKGRQAMVLTAVPFDEENKPLYVLPLTNTDEGAFDTLQEAIVALVLLVEQLQREGNVVALCKPFFQSSASEPLQLTQDFVLNVKHLIEAKGVLSKRAMLSPVIGGAWTNGRECGWLRGHVPIFTADTSTDSALCTNNLPLLSKILAVHYFQDVLMFFEPVINEDGTRMGSIDLLIAHLSAVFKLFPSDAHLEYLLIEILFHMILQQPSSSAQNTLAYRVVLQLCKQNVAYPPVLALISNLLFQMVPDLDWEAAKEFGRWFAFHYVNTNLSWPYWDFWLSLCEKPADAEEEEDEVLHIARSQVSFFCQFTVNVIARLINPEKVHNKQFLPQEFAKGVQIDYKGRYGLFESDYPSSLSVVEEAATVAKQLKDMVQDKCDDGDVLEWLDDNSVSETEKGALFLHAALYAVSEGQTMTSILTMLERYDVVIRSFSESSAQQQHILVTLEEIYGHSSYMFGFIMDEMLRRGQLSVVTVASYLKQRSVSALGKQTEIHAWMEMLCDRSLDFVRACGAMCSHLFQHNGNGIRLVLDESNDLLTAAESPAAMEVNTTEQEATSDEVAEAPHTEPEKAIRDQEEVDYDGMDEEHIAKRAKNDHVVVAGDSMEEEAVDPLLQAEEALKTAVVNARSVFHALLSSLVDILTSDGDDGDARKAIAVSVLNRMLRVYYGAERSLSLQWSQKVVLTNRRGAEGNVVIELGEEKVQSQALFNDLMQRLEAADPQLYRAWASFI